MLLKSGMGLISKSILFLIITIGIRTSVQAEVERPFTYLLARCPSSCQQLTYSEVRLTDIQQWNNSDFVVDGISIKDNVRFFKGNIDDREFTD